MENKLPVPKGSSRRHDDIIFRCASEELVASRQVVEESGVKETRRERKRKEANFLTDFVRAFDLRPSVV